MRIFFQILFPLPDELPDLEAAGLRRSRLVFFFKSRLFVAKFIAQAKKKKKKATSPQPLPLRFFGYTLNLLMQNVKSYEEEGQQYINYV